MPQRTSACSSSVSSSRWRLSVSSVRKSSPYRASRAWFPREARSDVTEITLRFCSLHRRSLSRNIMSSSCCHTLVITPVLLTKSRIKTPGQGVWVCALCAPHKLAQRGKNKRHMKPWRKIDYRGRHGLTSSASTNVSAGSSVSVSISGSSRSCCHTTQLFMRRTGTSGWESPLIEAPWLVNGGHGASFILRFCSFDLSVLITMIRTHHEVDGVHGHDMRG
jgi:hypothetical protein